jgi:membrane-bound inhibitor of C-type lysozyme
MRKAILLCAAVAVPICSCTGMKTGGLTVRGGDPVYYGCGNGERIVARYYSLSDDSLRFVKVIMPDGREYTLPNVISGSGARYTDELEKVWWTKGNTGFVQARDRNGDWQIEYRDCLEISEK